MTDDSRRAPSHEVPVKVASVRQAGRARGNIRIVKTRQKISQKQTVGSDLPAGSDAWASEPSIQSGFFFPRGAAVREGSSCSVCGASASAKVRRNTDRVVWSQREDGTLTLEPLWNTEVRASRGTAAAENVNRITTAKREGRILGGEGGGLPGRWLILSQKCARKMFFS